jgi:EmrB/QacA subfamily drug resistance transporter
MTNARAETVPITHRQVRLVFVGLMLGLFLAALDQTIVSTALPTIVGDLGGINHLSWVVTAYLVTSTVAMPLFGKLSDLYGRKICFQAAIGSFLVASALAGLSQTMGQLIVFRALQGIGGGGILALSFAIVGDIVAPRERGRYQGYTTSVFAVSSVVGPLLGGFFVDHASWRWIFYVNIPVGLVALVVVQTVLNLPRRHVSSHSIDFVGAALLIAGVTSLLLVTVWGGTEFAWSSPVIAGLILAGVALLCAFCLWERRATDPILPLRLFANPTFRVTLGTGFMLGLAMFSAIVFLPVYMQVVQGQGATSSGLLLLPFMGGILITATGAGQVISRIGRYKLFPVTGMAVLGLGFLLLSTMGTTTPRLVYSCFMFVTGSGVGLCMPVLVLAVQNAVDHRDLGTATSALTFFRSMGGAFGVAVLGALFNSRLTDLLSAIPRASLEGISAASLKASPATIRSLPTHARESVVAAYADAITTVFLVAAPVCVLALVVVSRLRETPLRETAHVGFEGGEMVRLAATDEA